jgi:hypothetical protein
MSKFAVRLLTLAISATALVLVPTVAPAKAETSSSRHIKKHKRQQNPGFIAPRSAVACEQASEPARPGLPGPRPKLRLSGVASSV